MSSRNQRPVGRRSATSVFYLLAIGSGVMRTVSVSFDIVALNTMISDSIAFGFMAQWLALGVTVVLIAFLSIPRKHNGRKRPIGYSLDPDFGRLRLLPRRPMKYLIAGGLLAGGSTFFYYLLAGHTDASTILPYGQLVIIYLLLGDLLAEKDIPTIIEVQCIVSITLGVLLVGVTPGGFDIPSLLIVLGPMNVFSALYTYLQRRAKRMEIRPGLRVDSLNMRLWTLLFMNVSMSLMMLPLMTPATWTLILQTFVPLFWVLLGSALTTFLAMVMYVRALGKGKMAVVNSLAAVSVVLGIPVTLLGNLILPGAFGAITYDAFLWALKIFGVTLVVVGVLALQAADVRSLVLVSVNPRAGSLIDALFDIKGVETAAALAGKHDYLLRVRGRSLTKTRSAVLKKIQKVPGVVSVRTLIVLADYK